MRHRKEKYTLDRKAGARNSLIKNLAESLVLRVKIKTTVAKAIAARPLTENFISWGKRKDLHGMRMLRRYLTEKATKVLVNDIVPALGQRDSGYTRITPLGFRQGDGAEMVLLEYLVESKAKEAVDKKEDKKPSAVK